MLSGGGEWALQTSIAALAVAYQVPRWAEYKDRWRKTNEDLSVRTFLFRVVFFL